MSAVDQIGVNFAMSYCNTRVLSFLSRVPKLLPWPEMTQVQQVHAPDLFPRVPEMLR